MEKGGRSRHKCQDDFSCLYPSLFRLAPKSDAFGVAETTFSPIAAFKTQVLYFKSPDTIGIEAGKCGLTIFVFRKEPGEEIALPVGARPGSALCAFPLPAPLLLLPHLALSFPHFCSIQIPFPWWWDYFRRCFKLAV